MSYGYDDIGQLTQVDASRPSDAARYAYDATGNPVRRAELGFEVTNAFNNLNQILSGTWTGGTITAVGTVNYPGGAVSVGGARGTIYPDKTFDAAGVPVSLGANTLTNVFTDPYGRSATNTTSVTITNRAYAHDLNGNLTSDGVFTYQYDSANQLTNVIRLADNTRILSCRYDALGRRVEAIRSDGTVDRYVYFPGSFLVLAVLDENKAPKELYTRGPDLSGTLSSAGGIGGILSSFALTLDDADQRTQVIREDGKVYTYAYDATGNPIEQNKNGLVYSNSFNNLNQNAETRFAGALAALGTYSSPLAATVTVNNVQAQLHEGDWAAAGIPFVQGTNILTRTIQDLAGRSASATSTVVVADRTYAYDANGNMTTNGVFTYVWDCENRLTEVWKNGALVQSNRYDALWRRREKIEYAPDGTAVTNRYIYKDWLVLAIADGSGNVLETYTHGADLSGAVGGSGGGNPDDLNGQISFKGSGDSSGAP